MPDISPLFAVEAEKLLSEGKTDDAIELCEKGILVYPKYPVALSILAKAYRIKGEIDTANEKLAAVEQFRPNYKAIETTKIQIAQPEFTIEPSSEKTESQAEENIDKTIFEASKEADIDEVNSHTEEVRPEEDIEIPKTEEENTEDDFDINPEDIDAIFASDDDNSESTENEQNISSEENSELNVEPEENIIIEGEFDPTLLDEIADELYDKDTQEEVELTYDISDNLTAELDNLIGDIEETNTFIAEATPEDATKQQIITHDMTSSIDSIGNINEVSDTLQAIEEEPTEFDLNSELDDLEYDEDLEGISDELSFDDEEEAPETPQVIETKSAEFNVNSELDDLEYDEDLEGISDELQVDDIEDQTENPQIIETKSAEQVASKTEEVDLSKLPKNAKMSYLIDDSVSAIRAKDVSLIPGLKTSPLQAESSVKSRNYSEQILPTHPAFPDSISVNAITSTLGNNWEENSIDLDDNDIDRSGAEDNFSMLADKIKNLSMPKIEELDYGDEIEDYAPPTIISPTIATLLAIQGRTKEAIAAYEKLILEDPDNADAYREKIEELG